MTHILIRQTAQQGSKPGLQSCFDVEEEAQQLGAEIQLRQEQKLQKHGHYSRPREQQFGLRMHRL